MTHQPIVDFGAHVHPTDPEPYAFIHRFIEDRDGSAICTDLEAVAARYRESIVDAAVLSQPLFMSHDEEAATRAGNDAFLEAIQPYDEFYALAGLPTGSGGEAAAAEFRRCLEAGYNGGAIEAGGGTRLTDEAYAPVFEVADQTGAPIMVHPQLLDSLDGASLDDSLQENAIWGREVALALSIGRVIHGGVLDRYPNLNLVYHHLGGNIASMTGRIRLRLEQGHWPGLEDVKSFEAFVDQLADRIYLDTSGYGGQPAALELAVESLSESQLLYATDFPYETRAPATFERIAESIQGAAPGGADQILGGNALDLLVNVN